MLEILHGNIVAFNFEDIDAPKMGINANGEKILKYLITLSQRGIIFSQKTIASKTNLSLNTVNKNISFFIKANYVKHFKSEYGSYGYMINWHEIIEFLKDNIKKKFHGFSFYLTQWLHKKRYSIKILHSSYINNKFFSKTQAKQEKPVKKNSDSKKENLKGTVLKFKTQCKKVIAQHNKIEENKKEMINGFSFNNYKSKSRSKSLSSKLKTMTKCFSNKKHDETHDENLGSVLDKFMTSMKRQMVDQHGEEYFKQDKQPEREKPKALNQCIKNIIYSDNPRENYAYKKIINEYGASLHEAKLAIENAAKNKMVKYPFAYVSSSKKAFIVNLEQANKEVSRNAYLRNKKNSS